MTTELTDNTCDTCGFDASARSREETIAVVSSAADLMDRALGSIEMLLNERPDEETWSPLEYVDHVREVFRHSRLICEQALARSGQEYEGGFPPALSEVPSSLDRGQVISSLREEAQRNAEVFGAVTDDQWADFGLVTEMRWTLRFALPHISHGVLHHRDDITNRNSTSN